MSFSFKSIGHGLAWVAHKIVIGAKAMEKILPALAGQEKLIEGVTAFVDPRAVVIERAAFHVLGEVLASVKDADAAVSAKGIVLELDAQVIADLKQLAQDLRGDFSALGIPVAK